MTRRVWMDGLGDVPMGLAAAPDTTQRIRELEHQIGRLTLLNQAMWELLRGRLGLSDSDLEGIARDVDLRDGVEDGKMTVTPMECPQCGRISSSKHWKCLYCGQLFEKPVMG